MNLGRSGSAGPEIGNNRKTANVQGRAAISLSLFSAGRGGSADHWYGQSVFRLGRKNEKTHINRSRDIYWQFYHRLCYNCRARA